MAKKTKARKPKKTTKPPVKTARASWKGLLRFGLVSFGVQASNALLPERSDIRFHQLHAKCHRRIRYDKVCPKHGPVPRDEIVSGYEHARGHYVEMEPGELDKLRTEADKALTIDTFIQPAELDPIYLDGRMYWLLPENPSSDEAYAVLAEAMRKQDRWGVGHVVFSGKEQLVLLRSVEGLLQMAMLNYSAEIRSPEEMRNLAPTSRPTARTLQMAESLIETWSEKAFDYDAYKDFYRERVEQLIEARLKGHEISAPPEEEETPVINLMEALKKSLHRGPNGATRPTERRSAGRARSAGRKRRAS